MLQHIYKVEGLQMLHDLAMSCTEHVHPDSQAAGDIRQLRPDVHERLVQIYR